MIISDENDRKELDDCLNGADSTLLLLIGSMSTKSKDVYDCFYDKYHDPWHFCFLITDKSVLKEDESKNWFNENIIDYAVIGGKVIPKKVAKAGPITDLLLKTSGDPDYLEIRAATLLGDTI